MADFEDLQSRSERLANGPRLAEIDRLTVSIEHELPTPAEGTFSALSMQLTDAILDWDEAALDLALVNCPVWPHSPPTISRRVARARREGSLPSSTLPNRAFNARFPQNFSVTSSPILIHTSSSSRSSESRC